MIHERVRHILGWYGSETPGVRAQIARLLTHGALKNTGRLLVMAVDQGFEHGPGRCFLEHPDGFDPTYHAHLAMEQGLSAFAAPLGFLEHVVDRCAGQLPLILKLNHAWSLTPPGTEPHLAQVASVDDALRLGCIGVGWTLYPGSKCLGAQLEALRAVSCEAKSKGLVVVVWSYPRGAMSKQEERGIDVVAYGAHMACLAGAHIVKVKIPEPTFMAMHEPFYRPLQPQWDDIGSRIRHILQSCFQGKRLVLFSGGEKKEPADLLNEVRAIHQAGGSGSIMGRNLFQRPRPEAEAFLRAVVATYAITDEKN